MRRTDVLENLLKDKHIHPGTKRFAEKKYRVVEFPDCREALKTGLQQSRSIVPVGRHGDSIEPIIVSQVAEKKNGVVRRKRNQIGVEYWLERFIAAQ